MSAANPVVRVTRRFDASPERVFDAWIDPAKVGTWMVAPSKALLPTPDVMVACDLDPRVGGRFRFVVLRGGDEVAHTGEYLAFERPRRLAFTWAVPRYSAEVTVVRLGFAPLGTGTELTLAHERVLPEHRPQTEAGWGRILDAIAGALGEP